MRNGLSPRQDECLRLSADMSDKDIARHLGITPGVVNKHIQEAMRRLGVNDRRAARRSMGYFTPGLADTLPEMTGIAPSQDVAPHPDDDHPPTRYRPTPGGLVSTAAIIGQFALVGGLVILVIIVVFGIRNLR